MFNRFQKDEEGFTLIELLVVVIIIGILAAIAIPTFLSQRERGWQAELTSGLRNAALEVEADATANGGIYPVTADGQLVVDDFVINNLGQVANVATVDDPLQLTYTGVSATEFLIDGVHISLPGATQQYDNTAGGIQAFVPA